ncbi:MAG: bifunctional riboflavin kinase/FAD synthetase [Gammaproteobacteria bacterium]|nr:bifunctional riboflavin kinase/FAD synthetase [Gammaproteobacteria bacterium]
MKLIRGLYNIPPNLKGCVVSIGNFDGIHLGHQQVITQLTDKAAELNLPSVVITFEPQPPEYFSENAAPSRLTRFREKFQALRQFSIDYLFYLRFDAAMVALSAEEFVQKVLINGLNVRYLVVGDDFRFGYRRQGDFALLKKMGEKLGFQVVQMNSFDMGQQRVSSTRIRHALTQGDLTTAENLLGRPYRISGRVAHGDKLGRTLGFPTANIHLHRKTTPLSGIYAVEVFGLKKEPVIGAASIGTRPTVGGKQYLLEIHLLDFSEDVYGHYVDVDFKYKLREELHFESLEILKQQIKKDVARVRQLMNIRSNTQAQENCCGQ